MTEQRTRIAQFDQPAGFARLDTVPALGPITIAWSEFGITRLRFGVEPLELPARPLPSAIADHLRAYFSGALVDPVELPVDLTGATEFQRRVWTALRTVERGRVRTYGGLAKDVGSPRAMRAIGMAMGHNPIAIVVPCHRCVAQGMALGGFTSGVERKRWLLELEGVRVENDRVLPGQLDLL